MPHAARRLSESGFYHVVPKGIHDQLIFHDDADRRFYIELLDLASKRYGVHIHSYCLMSNHVHLVLEDLTGSLASFMKLVDERYGSFFAEKTGRKGGIFVRPLWSEPIESDAYLLCAVRYVHANPASAAICCASAYEWSSAKDYLGRNGITFTKTVLSLFGGRDGFIEWSRSENSTLLPFPGSKLKRHLSDDEIRRVAMSILGYDITELGTHNKVQQKTDVRKLFKRGMSVSQLARLTGLGRSELYRLLKP